MQLPDSERLIEAILSLPDIYRGHIYSLMYKGVGFYAPPGMVAPIPQTTVEWDWSLIGLAEVRRRPLRIYANSYGDWGYPPSGPLLWVEVYADGVLSNKGWLTEPWEPDFGELYVKRKSIKVQVINYGNEGANVIIDTNFLFISNTLLEKVFTPALLQQLRAEGRRIELDLEKVPPTVQFRKW
jgi:hypothetical protein